MTTSTGCLVCGCKQMSATPVLPPSSPSAIRMIHCISATLLSIVILVLFTTLRWSRDSVLHPYFSSDGERFCTFNPPPFKDSREQIWAIRKWALAPENATLKKSYHHSRHGNVTMTLLKIYGLCTANWKSSVTDKIIFKYKASLSSGTEHRQEKLGSQISLIYKCTVSCLVSSHESVHCWLLGIHNKTRRKLETKTCHYSLKNRLVLLIFGNLWSASHGQQSLFYYEKLLGRPNFPKFAIGSGHSQQLCSHRHIIYRFLTFHQQVEWRNLRITYMAVWQSSNSFKIHPDQSVHNSYRVLLQYWLSFEILLVSFSNTVHNSSLWKFWYLIFMRK